MLSRLIRGQPGVPRGEATGAPWTAHEWRVGSLAGFLATHGGVASVPPTLEYNPEMLPVSVKMMLEY